MQPFPVSPRIRAFRSIRETLPRCRERAVVHTQGRLGSHFTWGCVYIGRIGSPPQSERTSLLLSLSLSPSMLLPLFLHSTLSPQLSGCLEAPLLLAPSQHAHSLWPQLKALHPFSPSRFLCINYTSSNCLPPNSNSPSSGSSIFLFFSFAQQQQQFWCTTRFRQSGSLHTHTDCFCCFFCNASSASLIRTHAHGDPFTRESNYILTALINNSSCLLQINI